VTDEEKRMNCYSKMTISIVWKFIKKSRQAIIGD
jgi:hypothetical protein